MHDMTTPSSGEILKKYLPSTLRPIIWISNENPEEEYDSYDYHIVLKDGHWFADVKGCIYDSLGKPHPDLLQFNKTKYLILQSAVSAVCGAYASLFCISAIESGDPITKLQIDNRTHFVLSDKSTYSHDVRHKDKDIRDENDKFVSSFFNQTNRMQ